MFCKNGKWVGKATVNEEVMINDRIANGCDGQSTVTMGCLDSDVSRDG